MNILVIFKIGLYTAFFLAVAADTDIERMQISATCEALRVFSREEGCVSQRTQASYWPVRKHAGI